MRREDAHQRGREGRAGECAQRAVGVEHVHGEAAAQRNCWEEKEGAHGLDERVWAEGFHGQVPIWMEMLRRVAGN